MLVQLAGEVSKDDQNSSCPLHCLIAKLPQGCNKIKVLLICKVVATYPRRIPCIFTGVIILY